MRQWWSRMERTRLGKGRAWPANWSMVDAHLQFLIDANLEQECRLSKRIPRPGASSAIGSSCRSEAIKRGNSRDLNLCCRTFVMHGAGLEAPAFSLLMILTLAVGIGANTAIFSFVNAILLHTLPYPSANRLAILWSGLGDSGRAPFSSFELYELRQRSKQFDQLAGICDQRRAPRRRPRRADQSRRRYVQFPAASLPAPCARPLLRAAG